MEYIDYSKITKAEMEIIDQIARKAFRTYQGPDILDITHLTMDLCAVQSQIPLRLEEFLNAERGFDFWHDIHGIRGHLNRETLTLEDGFLPRFTL